MGKQVCQSRSLAYHWKWKSFSISQSIGLCSQDNPSRRLQRIVSRSTSCLASRHSFQLFLFWIVWVLQQYNSNCLGQITRRGSFGSFSACSRWVGWCYRMECCVPNGCHKVLHANKYLHDDLWSYFKINFPNERTDRILPRLERSSIACLPCQWVIVFRLRALQSCFLLVGR